MINIKFKIIFIIGFIASWIVFYYVEQFAIKESVKFINSIKMEPSSSQKDVSLPIDLGKYNFLMNKKIPCRIVYLTRFRSYDLQKIVSVNLEENKYYFEVNKPGPYFINCNNVNDITFITITRVN